MEQAGKNGILKVRLVSADPAPVAKGNNHWTIQVLDLSGKPVEGAAVQIKPFMPDHGHGTSIQPKVTPGEAGQFEISNLVLFMPGLWTVTFTVTTPTPTTDTAVFGFCIGG
jgi:uncharacterized GH25 family protein